MDSRELNQVARHKTSGQPVRRPHLAEPRVCPSPPQDFGEEIRPSRAARRLTDQETATSCRPRGGLRVLRLPLVGNR